MPKFDSESAKKAGKKSKRGISITNKLKEMIANKNSNWSEEFILENIERQIMEGNSKVLEMVWNRLDGKVADKLDVKSDERKIITFAEMVDKQKKGKENK